MPKQLTYCPICGHTLGTRTEGGRLRQACDNCGYVHYVNPIPGVGIVIEMDGGVVLIQRANPPHRGRWALPSGYIEADESAEEGAIREAEEETGLKVEIIEMAGINSFPEGPPQSGIMIFYRARPIGGTLKAGDDAAEARVFQPADLPLLPFRTHREMLAQWLARHAPATGARGDDRVIAGDVATVGAASTPDFLIRDAEAADANEIMALLGLIPANRGVAPDEWRDITQRFRELDGIQVFVAVARQTPPIIIGFLALSVARALTESRGVINDMAVLPTYQRHGVGAALLEAAIRRAERLGLRALWVNAARANDSAKAFYASLGFAETEVMQVKLR
ncbi:MAG: GNAT family N-acetyltransferase [Chloroflexota bacterium]|nr:GNAT family N-acetyltransferase [Chloroflexota bacterium]